MAHVSSLPVEHRPQTICLHRALSCFGASVYVYLYLNHSSSMLLCHQLPTPLISDVMLLTDVSIIITIIFIFISIIITIIFIFIPLVV